MLNGNTLYVFCRQMLINMLSNLDFFTVILKWIHFCAIYSSEFYVSSFRIKLMCILYKKWFNTTLMFSSTAQLLKLRVMGEILRLVRGTNACIMFLFIELYPVTIIWLLHYLGAHFIKFSIFKKLEILFIKHKSIFFLLSTSVTLWLYKTSGKQIKNDLRDGAGSDVHFFYLDQSKEFIIEVFAISFVNSKT